MSSLLLVRLTSCAGPALTSLVTSLVAHTDAEDPLYETEGRGVGSCPVSIAIFF